MNAFLPVSAGMRELAAGVRRGWKYVVAGGCAAGVAAMVLVALQAPVYEARAKVAVDVAGLPTASVNAQRIVTDQVRVMRGSAVRTRAKELLGLPALPPAPRVLVDGRSNVLQVVSRAGDPDTGQHVADAYVAAYLDVSTGAAAAATRATFDRLTQGAERTAEQLATVRQNIEEAEANASGEAGSEEGSADTSELGLLAARLEARLVATERQLGELEVQLEVASELGEALPGTPASRTPVEPTPASTVAVAVAGGVLMGMAGALYRPRRRTSANVAREWEDAVGAPVLAVLSAPHDETVKLSPDAPPLRGLRVALRRYGDDGHHSLALTAATPHARVDALVAALARLSAAAGDTTLVVDAHLARPRMAEVLGYPELSGTTGLADVAEDGPASSVVRNVAPRLWLVPTGSSDHPMDDVLSTERCSAVLRAWRRRVQVMLVNAPWVDSSGAAAAVAAATDATVVVVDDRDWSEVVSEAVRQLRAAGVVVAGLVVLTHDRDRGAAET